MGSVDLSSLSPDQLAGLKAQLDGLSDTTGRSPIRPRQLHDLRLLPTATDPRPLFIPSAEAPRNATDLTRTTPYPRLLFDADTGVDVTAQDAPHHRRLLAEGYVEIAPVLAPVAPLESVQAEFHALSDEDQALVLEGQRQARIAALQAKLSALPESAVTALTADKEADAPKRGRPRKTAS
jgi:hypothetical protein